MSQKMPSLIHEAANHLNCISAVAGCLLDRIKSIEELPVSLKDELTKHLKTIETKVQDSASELNKIKEELNARGQYT